MPKIKKDTIKKLPQTPTLKIFKYDNSNKFHCSFYVGYNHGVASGSVQKSLKTENRAVAEKLAKELYKEWWLDNENKVIKKKEVLTKILLNHFLKQEL